MRYAIGDVARTLGLTPGALHYFEREGVIAPMKGGATRRFYGAEDVIRLISYKKYRGMEVPLKEIARQFSRNGDSFAAISERMARQRTSALETSERYARLAQDIGWFADATARAERCGDRVDVATMPDGYLLRVGRDGFISKDREEQSHVARWMEELPATRVSVTGSGEAACFCYTVDAERGEQLGLDQTPGAVRLTPSIALHGFVRVPAEYYDQPAMAFAFLERYREEHGFTAAGDALGIDLCVECVDGKRDTLVEVWCPFA